MPVEERFIIDLKGKKFVMLGGLLQLAHEQGIRAIETALVPEMCNAAERSFVVQAIGRFRTGEGEDAVWSAYGDASPSNSQMRGAELRHAETRAIARMLRFACNVAMTAFEEMGPDVEPETPSRSPQQPRTGRPAPSPAPRPTPAPQPPPVPPGEAICSWPDCGAVLSADEILGSRKHFGERLLCAVHGREAKKQQHEVDLDDSGFSPSPHHANLEAAS